MVAVFASSYSKTTQHQSCRAIQAERIESNVRRAILSLNKVNSVLTTNKQLKAIAQQRPNKYATVERHCVNQGYGNWDTCHPNILLDKFFKCDLLINYKGWIIGIDVTTLSDDTDVRAKARQIQSMKRDHDQLGIDIMLVISAQSVPTQAQLVSALDHMIQLGNGVYTTYL